MAQKEQKRKLKRGSLGNRFFRVELTNKDCRDVLDTPEEVAQSVEMEFHPATFMQFINSGLGIRFALMRRKEGDD